MPSPFVVATAYVDHAIFSDVVSFGSSGLPIVCDAGNATRKLVVDAVAAQEQEELARRERAYHGDLPPHDVKEKTVILVDDGIATGSTMLAAVAALRQLDPDRIVVAAPVIAGSTYYRIRRVADDVAAVIVPEEFYGVGEWYEDFSQTTDDEVRQFLAEATQRQLASTRHENKVV